MPDPSFYYAIYKRLQAVAAKHGAHQNKDSETDPFSFVGGFTLRRADSPFGIFGTLSPQASSWPDCTPGLAPLRANTNTTPEQHPLWAMLNATLVAANSPTPPLALDVPPDSEHWPTMPVPLPPGNGTVAQTYPDWIAANQPGKPRLIDALHTWIANGQPKDIPKSAPIDTATLDGMPEPKFPLKNLESGPILLVCSRQGDDGRRAGDGALPNPPAVPVPPHFWSSSQIFLTDSGGTIQHPAHLVPGASYYVAAVIGNSSYTAGGSVTFGAKPINVQADALAFNSFMGPNVPLMSLGELDVTVKNPVYEQYYLPRYIYDVAGFHFDVDDVFKRLIVEVGLKTTDAMRFGKSPEEWVRDSHPCVKVRIMSGEPTKQEGNKYLPAGYAPDIGASPLVDRHIAQRNLAHFDMSQMAIKPMWKDFIVAQAGKGLNGLSLQHSLPLDVVAVTLAVPRAAWDRYLDPKTSKGGAIRGFKIVRETVPPFPGDTVFLRQSQAKAEIKVADHARDEFFGMSLGLQGDSHRIPDLNAADVSMVHTDRAGKIVGGFTLRPVLDRTERHLARIAAMATASRPPP